MKGGEIVEIGGLGFVNTIASAVKDSTQATAGGSSSGKFGLILSGVKNAAENTSDATTEGNETNEDILKLLALLNTEDILEVEGGFELLNKSLSEDLLAGDDSLNGIVSRIQEMLGNIGSEDAEAKDGKLEELIQMLEQIVVLPINEFVQRFNGDMKDFIKAVKLFELVSKENDLKQDNSFLKDLLQQLSKKLESLLENKTSVDSAKQSSRYEFLQKTFTAVASEVNANSAKPRLSNEGNVETKSGHAINGFLQFQQISKAEQLSLNLSQSGKPTSAADLIKQFENILARSQFSNTAGAQKLLIKLNPEHLGALRIELIQRDAGLVAKIMTTTQLAKETLDSHLNGLKQAFGSQNIQVDRIEVSQSITQQQERFFNRDGQQGSQQQWQGREDNDSHDEVGEEKSFNFSLEEALVNTEA